MPGMDGYEATKRIRQMEKARGLDHLSKKNDFPFPSPEGPPQPACIAALTASALSEDRVRCALAGMDEFIVKPVSRKDILRVIEQRWRSSSEASGGSSGNCGLEEVPERESSHHSGDSPEEKRVGSGKLQQTPSLDVWTSNLGVSPPNSRPTSTETSPAKDRSSPTRLGGQSSAPLNSPILNFAGNNPSLSKEPPSIEQIWASIKSREESRSTNSQGGEKDSYLGGIPRPSRGNSLSRTLSRGNSNGSQGVNSPRSRLPKPKLSPFIRSPAGSPDKSPKVPRGIGRSSRTNNKSPDLCRESKRALISRSMSLEGSNLSAYESKEAVTTLIQKEGPSLAVSSMKRSSGASGRHAFDAKMWIQRTEGPEKIVEMLGVKLPYVYGKGEKSVNSLRRLKSSPAASPSTSPTSGSSTSPGRRLNNDEYVWPYG